MGQAWIIFSGPPMDLWWHWGSLAHSSHLLVTVESCLHFIQTYHQWLSRGPAEAAFHCRGSSPLANGWPIQRTFRGLPSLSFSSYSTDPPVCLLIFNSSDSGFQKPTWCHHTASSRGTELVFHLLPLVYRRQAYSVPIPLIASGSPLKGHRM